MSKLTETSKLKIEDFKEQRSWIGPLLEGYNNFLDQAIKLFNNGLLFIDNQAGIQHDFSFTFESASATFPQKVRWPYGSFPPKSLFVGAAFEGSTPVSVVCAWKFSDDRFIQLISVYKITSTPGLSALTSGTKYVIRVRVEP